MNSVRQLLHSAIDYAGLFPPASLGMNQALKNYAEYRATEHLWALGRFIIPASRLNELDEYGADQEIHLSLLIGPDVKADAAKVRRLQAKSSIAIDSIEAKIASAEDMDQLLQCFPGFTIYCEVPIDENIEALIASMGQRGIYGKIRAGGVKSELFPTPAQVSRFLVSCAERAVRFKATAGLHHAIRSFYPLTYEESGPSTMMHGFLNLLIAAAAAYAGCCEETVEQILSDESRESFHFEAASIGWNVWSFPNKHILAMRERFLVSFGSCSFVEPISDMKKLGLL